jgi:hypothetical protein
VTNLSPFGDAEWGPSPSIVYGSQSLPMIPDGRISRVRFEAATAPPCAFLPGSELKPVVGIPSTCESLRPA